MKKDEIPALASSLNGWWCEACGKYVLQSEAVETETVYLCKECAETDRIPQD